MHIWKATIILEVHELFRIDKCGPGFLQEQDPLPYIYLNKLLLKKIHIAPTVYITGYTSSQDC